MDPVKKTPSYKCDIIHIMSQFGCSNMPLHKVMQCLNSSLDDFKKCIIKQ